MMNTRFKQAIKVLASCCIAAHLGAIFVAPASVAPTSPMIYSTWSACSSYLYNTNLNHGYHFFAPEPGASSLLEYRGKTSDGEIKHGVLPDKQQMRPRLLYHRYFMLTEYLGSFADDDPARQPVIHNFARQLLENEGLDQVELKLVRHRPSTRQEILIGEDLNSAETYERESLGTFTWEKIQSFQRSSNK
jgi:hypothetical protein